MLPTPDTSHVDYGRVYEPAEDSYLLLDTLASPDESAFLQQHFSDGPSPFIFEVGTGSGVVLAFVVSNAGSILGRRDVLGAGVDVNSFACSGTARSVQKAISDHESGCHNSPLFLGSLNADLTGPMRPQQIDILIFNPPYVPAPLPDQDQYRHSTGVLSEQQAWDRDSHLLALSYAGGEDGMQVTHRLLDDLNRVLSPQGIAYVLLCAQNKPVDVIARIQAWKGSWSARVVGSSGKQAGWEKLVILRIWRDQAVRK